MKISIVIVNYNQGPYLEACIRSVIDQNYPELELIMVDGGSDDGSLEIIQKYADHFSWWVSQPDGGQYEAVQKGFEHSTGEVMAWLNSDDKYHSRSLFAVKDIFSTFSAVEWLMGFPTEYTENGAVVNRITLPWARWSKYRYLTYDFQFIQQESSFWRRSLWEKVGSTLDTSLDLAGDCELWARFFRHAKLYTTMTLLGGFRYRGGDQRSRTRMGEYLAECKSVIDRERNQQGVLGRFGLSIRRLIGFPLGMAFFFDIPFLRWPYKIWYQIPPVITFDFYLGKYVFSQGQVKHPPLFLGGKQISGKGIE